MDTWQATGHVVVFFFKQKTAYEIGLGIPAEPLLRSQKELTKMQLDNQTEIAEMQNETQKEIAGIQSATSRQNTKDQVYAQKEMLAYQQKEFTARVASIMENTNLSKIGRAVQQECRDRLRMLSSA